MHLKKSPADLIFFGNMVFICLPNAQAKSDMSGKNVLNGQRRNYFVVW